MSPVKPDLAPSIDDLLRRHELTNECIDGKVRECHMRTLSRSLAYWRELASYICLTEPDVAEIEHDCKTEPDKRLKTLKKWSNKHGPNAKYRLLLEAFLEIGWSNLAEQLCKLLGDSHSEKEKGMYFTVF